MKKLTAALAIAALAAASASAQQYKIIAPLGADADGAMAFLYNFDSGVAMDSVLVADGAATFTGTIDEPVLARINVDGANRPVFILESGTISFSKNNAPFGTMLNDRLRALTDSIGTITAKFRQAASEQEQEAIYADYTALLENTIKENADNMLGYYVFLNGDASQLDAADLRKELEKYPEFAKMERTKKILANAEKREATSPGNKFIDFAVTSDGTTKRLSDYVGKGRYTLVDFWASWCGPCMRQLPVLKELQAAYGDKGLDVLGVAVWDKPEDTKRAIADHELTWPCIIDAQTIPTDIYGITGIPCIILFGPDGTILSRDKQGDELKAAVAAEMEKAKK